MKESLSEATFLKESGNHETVWQQQSVSWDGIPTVLDLLLLADPQLLARVAVGCGLMPANQNIEFVSNQVEGAIDALAEQFGMHCGTPFNEHYVAFPRNVFIPQFEEGKGGYFIQGTQCVLIDITAATALRRIQCILESNPQLPQAAQEIDQACVLEKACLHLKAPYPLPLLGCKIWLPAELSIWQRYAFLALLLKGLSSTLAHDCMPDQNITPAHCLPSDALTFLSAGQNENSLDPIDQWGLYEQDEFTSKYKNNLVQQACFLNAQAAAHLIGLALDVMKKIPDFRRG